MNHSFNTDLAKKYGVIPAIVIENMAFWIKKNQANKKHFHDGRYWTYNSIKAFDVLFDYLTPDQIRRAIEKLVKEEVLIVGNYNKMPQDRTRWFGIKDNSICDIYNVELAKLPIAIGEIAEPLPDINSDINSDIKTKENASLVFFEEVFKFYKTLTTVGSHKGQAGERFKKLSDVKQQKLFEYLKEYSGRRRKIESAKGWLRPLPAFERFIRDGYWENVDLPELKQESKPKTSNINMLA